MRLSIKSKHLYLLALVVICLLSIVVMPTYANFGSETTFDDVVGINLNYTIGISNIEQFEEVVVPSNDSTNFNVNVTNSSGDIVYYGIWYKMVSPKSMPSDDSIKIGRLKDTSVSTSGGIENGDDITATIGIKNDTNEDIKIYIGVASSSTGINDIEYINGKYLISGEVEVPQNFATYIKNLYDVSRATSVHIGGDESKPQVSLDADSSIMLDNNGEYRYYGKNPNNYVEYNGELWRIISVSNVKSSENDTVGETRVRIIKDTKIGDYAWDFNNTNNWADATLMCQLNTMYYNDTIEVCTNKTLESLTTSLNTEASSLIDNALWYLGGGNDTNLYADDYYNMERNDAGYESNPTRWTGKLGLMYPSDYAYAADLSQCKNTGYNYTDRDSWEPNPNCAGTDWLFNGEVQWLITTNSEYSLDAWEVQTEGYIYSTDGACISCGYGVRPVVVLRSDVIITGGRGTSGDAYKISLKSDSDNSNSNLWDEPVNATTYIDSLYNDGSLTTDATVGDGTQTVSLNSNQKIMKINQGTINEVDYGTEYRYYSATPNNYVEFNGELWRIISSSIVYSSESDTTGKTRLRIIRDLKIGDYVWDDYSENNNGNYSNNWADATLMCQLNTMYYNDTIEACTNKTLESLTTSLNTEASSLIDNALWYLGVVEDTNLYADNYYNMERNNSGYESNPTRWTGKLGLMYLSDYAYAADLSQCKNTNYYTDTTNCTETDWLFNGDYQWLMSPSSGNYYDVFSLYQEGFLFIDTGDSFHGVRPVVVLKSDVLIVGGDGSSGNPYKLSLGT